MTAREAQAEIKKLVGRWASVGMAYDFNDPGMHYYLVGEAHPSVSNERDGWKQRKVRGRTVWKETFRKTFRFKVYGIGLTWQDAVTDALMEVMAHGNKPVLDAKVSRAYSRPVLAIDVSKYDGRFCPNHTAFKVYKEALESGVRETV